MVEFFLVPHGKKWFYEVVTRSMEKVVTSIGLYPVENYKQNKRYVGKYIYIVVTGYELLLLISWILIADRLTITSLQLMMA